MLRRTLYRAMMITIVYAVLQSLSSATASAWMPQANGTMAPVTPGARTAVIEAPRGGGRQEVRGSQGIAIEIFIGGMILGLFLGLLLGSRVLSHMLQRWQSRKEKQHDIDRLTEQFQALFRGRDQGKNHYP